MKQKKKTRRQKNKTERKSMATTNAFYTRFEHSN